MNYENGDVLPAGWVWTTIGDVIDTAKNRCNPQDFPDLRFVGLEHVQPHTTSISGYVPAASMRSTANYFQAGDVLYGRLRPYLNKVTSPEFDGLCSSEFIVFKKRDEINNKYLMYFLSSWSFVNFASHLNTGDRPRVDFEQLKPFPLPLPPLAEQHRIVEAIEAEFTRLDAGVAALKRLRANLKRYKAAVLKAATEGSLVPQDPNDEPAADLLQRILHERRQRWETEQRAKGRDPRKLKYDEPKAPDTDDLPELPEGWVWATVEQVGEVQLGRQRSPDNVSKDYPIKYIRAANITERGLDLSDVLEMEFTPREQQVYRLVQGDIVLSEASGSPDQVGKPAVWNNELENVCFQNTVIRLRPYEVDSHYLLTIFKHLYFNHTFARTAAGVGINHLSAGKFSRIPIPMAPKLEQIRIVDDVETRMTLIGVIEQQIGISLKRAERLRQAILRDAFAGRLVPQDLDDEPASELLKRLQKAGKQGQPK